MSERAPRVNPATGEVEMVEVNPATGEIIGTFTGQAVADDDGVRAVPPLPTLTPEDEADDAAWDPYPPPE